MDTSTSSRMYADCQRELDNCRVREDRYYLHGYFAMRYGWLSIGNAPVGLCADNWQMGMADGQGERELLGL